MSVEIVNERFMVCVDCAMFIANDDLSGLDYHFLSDESEQREIAIRNGVQYQNDQDNHIVMGNSDDDIEFSKSPCNCCGDHLHGYRYHAVLLK